MDIHPDAIALSPQLSPGDAIPTIDLSTIAQLQNINGPKTVAFRLYGWGNTSTADSNTTGLGRVNGPRLRGTITPSLVIVPVGSTVEVSWPTNASGFTLQSTTNLVPANWQTVLNPVGIVGDQYVVTSGVSGTQFFRLIK